MKGTMMLKFRLAVIATLLIPAASMALQTIIVGTGNPDIDVPAVRAAVDQGGRVMLMGHFSFDGTPIMPAGATYPRMVTVSKEVTIVGSSENEQGVRAVIDGGYIPLWVEAPGVHVTIQGLNFVRP